MAALNQNWLTEDLIDFEYKKYVLLAYLQEAEKYFDEKKLYPRLSELAEHYRNIRLFREKKKAVANTFPKKISKFDFSKTKIEYTNLFADDELLKELDAIVEFALPEIENKLGIGKELYEEVEDKLEVFPVGIIPLRNEEGYFFLSDYMRRLVDVYYYRVSIFENMDEKFRGIHAKFLFSYMAGIANTYEKMKHELIAQNAQMPNPATFAIEFKEPFPLHETMLPIAKRSLVKIISEKE